MADNVIAYICDQAIPHCNGRCQNGLSDCRHTLDDSHALYGNIDPEKVTEYPERFKIVAEDERFNFYEEVNRK